MTDPRVEKLARVVVDYSLGLKKGEAVSIAGAPAAAPLLLALYGRALEAGAFPHLRVNLPGAAELFYAKASPEQLDRLSDIDLYEAEHLTCSVNVGSETNTRALTGVPPEKLGRVRVARKALKDAKRKHRWNVTTFPTEAFAQDAEMSLADYEEFVFRACFCYEPDAVEAWKAFRETLRLRAAAFDRPQEVVLRGDGTNLRLRIGGRKICVSCGEVNMPDGEIYAGPVEDGVDGVIRFSFPAIMEGREIEDVRFEFAKGQVTKATAARNQSLLDRMLSLDEGARRVGELGLGCNYGVDRFTRNLMFDEKIGGTVHLGMGESYAETEGKNHSAIHLDFVCDLGKDGEILVDGKAIMRGRKYLV